MSSTTAASPPTLTRLTKPQMVWLLLGLAAVLWLIHQTTDWFTSFPESWNLGLAAPLDQFQRWVVSNRTSHWLFAYGFDPLSDGLDWMIRGVEGWLMWLPWPVLGAAVFLLAQKIAHLRTALLTTTCLLALGLLGLWDESMMTLALMLVSVLVAVAIGLPLGILTAKSDGVERWLRPLLDAMQTMPTFVYLIPVVLFFGVARVPSLIATVIYALPPVIRLTNLGIRAVDEEIIEAAQSFGSTPRQILLKVQLPLALPTIMAGVNQTIMMALGIVVIAALIGSGGLGDEVLRALRRLQVGQALEAGLAILFLAILLDRLSYALSQIERRSQPTHQPFRLLPPRWGKYPLARRLEEGLDWLYGVLGWPAQWGERWLGKGSYTAVTLLLLALLTAACFVASQSAPARFGGGLVWSGPLMEFPASWRISLRSPVDAAVAWAQVNLYEFDVWGGLTLGTGPLSDFVTLYLLRPLTNFLQNTLSWPVLILLVTAAAYRVGDGKLAAGTALSMLLVGGFGMWNYAMTTLAQVIVAVVLTIVLGIPLGIWSARSDRAAAVLRPILDFLQTIPAFVYLVPVIMLFNTGSVPGIIASVLYALPPVIRLTNLGIRQVDGAAVEAAVAFGSTPRQLLAKVQWPLALPTIMLGINQTVMMVLAMVIIAGLIGGAGLGFEVVAGLANNRLGRGLEAGLAIVVLAVIIDRLTQAWAAERGRAANL